MASVTLQDVTRSWGDVHVVRGVNMTIEDGEFVVLVGASGCGKSTLLRLLVGLDQPSSGTIRIGDRVVNEIRPRDRDVAMVFQSYALYPHMTVRENMAFALKVGRAPQAEIDAAVAEAARMLELGELLERYPKQLSGGQRQRVAMGRALVRRPRVFLFDEPLSNLDAALRAQMRIELKRLHRTLGITTVYVTHDQVEAMTLADRVALMHRGVIQQYGPPRTLFDWPANRYVAGFLGSPTMNFWRGRIDGDVVVAGEMRIPFARSALMDGVGDGTEVEIGARPHQLRPAPAGDGCIRGVTYGLEPMGWETIVHFDAGGVRCTARVDVGATQAEIGVPVGFSIDPADTRLFAAADGRALLRPAT